MSDRPTRSLLERNIATLVLREGSIVKITWNNPSGLLPKLSAARAQEALELNRNQLAALEATGLLPDRRIDRVAALADRSWGSSDAPLTIVRLGAPKIDPSDGRAFGYDVRYTDAEVLGAGRCWWTGNPDDVVRSRHLLTTTGTFVTSMLEIDGLEASIDIVDPKTGHVVRRHQYEARLVARVDDMVHGTIRIVSPPSGDLAPLLSLIGRRLPSPQGSPLVTLPPGSTHRPSEDAA